MGFVLFFRIFAGYAERDVSTSLDMTDEARHDRSVQDITD